MPQPAYPQPEWNTPDSVSMALEAVSNATDKESSQSAYSEFLYAIGNNHAGTYYPVVLTTFTDIEAILRSGKPWPQHTVIEALIDLLVSFTPEPGQEVFREHSLSEELRERITGLKRYFSFIATGNDVAAVSAKEILKHLNGEGEQVGAADGDEPSIAPPTMPELPAEPILAWSVPERQAPSNLDDSEVIRLLTARPRRGRIAMLLTAVVGALACGYFAAFHSSIPWGLTSGIVAIFGFYCFNRLNQKIALARRIAADPRLVFWIHPTLLKQQVSGQTFETPFITLHSRDAGTFEVAMPVDRLVAITHWYQEQNPSVRVGAYDRNEP